MVHTKMQEDGDKATSRKRDRPTTEGEAQVGASGVDEGAVGGPANSAPNRQRGRKRRKAAGDAIDVPPEEAARRKRQAELRAIAVRLRDSGQIYSSYRQRKQKHRNTDGSGASFIERAPQQQPPAGGGGSNGKQEAVDGEGKDKGGRSSKKAVFESGEVEEGAPRKQLSKNYKGDKEPGWRPFNSVEVIVLPIFWNTDKDEKARVMAASEGVQAALTAAGITTDLDSSNKYTPGQKMKYWETMGVRVRIELGPRDAENGRCVVALAGAPGTVAHKSIVSVGDNMLAAVRKALAKTGAKGGSGKASTTTPRHSSSDAAMAQDYGHQHGDGDNATGGGAGLGDEDEEERKKRRKDKKKLAKDKKKRLNALGRPMSVSGAGGGGEGGEEEGEEDGEEADGERDEDEQEGSVAARGARGTMSRQQQGNGQFAEDEEKELEGFEQGADEWGGDDDEYGVESGAGFAAELGEDDDDDADMQEADAFGGKQENAHVADDMEADFEDLAPAFDQSRGAQRRGKVSQAQPPSLARQHASQPAAAAAMSGGHGGDDLEDDFDIQIEEPEEDKLTLSKDERKQKARKLEKERRRRDKHEAKVAGGGSSRGKHAVVSEYIDVGQPDRNTAAGGKHAKTVVF